MNNVQAQFAEFNQTALQVAIGLANLSVENAERLVYLNLESAKSAIEESAEQAKALSEVRDVQELAAIRARAAEASLEKALAYSRSIYEIANEAQSRITQLLGEQFSFFNQNMVSAAENVVRTTQNGFGSAMSNFTSSINSGTASSTQARTAAESGDSPIITASSIQNEKASGSSGNPSGKAGSSGSSGSSNAGKRK